MKYSKLDAKDYAREQMKGIWAAALNPFNEDLSFNEAGLRSNIRHWVEDLEIAGAGSVVTAIGEQLDSFAETAAVIEALDLVIMTDSSVAHLAGSLGHPVWNLLNKATYWLYRGQGETTPWYPSMRLYRQSVAGNWDPVFDQVRKDLEAAVAAKRRGNWPPKT